MKLITADDIRPIQLQIMDELDAFCRAHEIPYTLLGGTLIGVLIIGVLNNGLNLMGVDSNWQYIVKGLVILLAVYVDFIRNKKAGR